MASVQTPKCLNACPAADAPPGELFDVFSSLNLVDNLANIVWNILHAVSLLI